MYVQFSDGVKPLMTYLPLTISYMVVVIIYIQLYIIVLHI